MLAQLRAARHHGKPPFGLLTEQGRQVAWALRRYQKADGTFVSKPLEDLFPFLPREEFLANMIVKPLPE